MTYRDRYQVRRTVYEPMTDAEFAERYIMGESLFELAFKSGRSERKARQMLLARGVTLRPKGLRGYNTSDKFVRR